jgi:flagellar protein FliS
MTSEEIREYTQRITQSNRTELIVILFDIYNTYVKEALEALENCNDEKYRDACHNASMVLLHLRRDLDFKYPQSKSLYSLYDYCNRCMAKAIYSKDKKEIDRASDIMTKMRESFMQLAQGDKSEPLMKNAQRITFGITYDRKDVTGIQENYDVKRGYFA